MSNTCYKSSHTNYKHYSDASLVFGASSLDPADTQFFVFVVFLLSARDWLITSSITTLQIPMMGFNDWSTQSTTEICHALWEGRLTPANFIQVLKSISESVYGNGIDTPVGPSYNCLPIYRIPTVSADSIRTTPRKPTRNSPATEGRSSETPATGQRLDRWVSRERNSNVASLQNHEVGGHSVLPLLSPNVSRRNAQFEYDFFLVTCVFTVSQMTEHHPSFSMDTSLSWVFVFTLMNSQTQEVLVSFTNRKVWIIVL
jgi:hypothetical protein